MPWLVLQIIGSALAVGTVLALQAVPRAVLMIVGGAVADRVSPRPAMVGSAATRAVAIGALAALILTRQVQLWEVYVAALAVGVVSAFFLPARFAVLSRSSKLATPCSTSTSREACSSAQLLPAF